MLAVAPSDGKVLKVDRQWIKKKTEYGCYIAVICFQKL